MPRTTADLVKGVLMDNYGPRLDGSLPDLTPFINAANVLTSRVATCAEANDKTLTADELTVLETWLAAHYYAKSDRTMSYKSTGKGQATFDGKTDMHLNFTPFGQTAVELDTSGCLVLIVTTSTEGGVKRASAFWAGKPPSQQVPYLNRN